jgi:outer membrane protein OmpA-like peptidoglycan-associated protein
MGARARRGRQAPPGSFPGRTGGQGPAGLTRAQGEAAPVPAPPPAIRRTSLKEIMFEFDQADIRYSKSRKFRRIAAHAGQYPSVRVAIDGYTG